ncbi:extracellular solute-binding protein [Streptomyces sp. NPDC046985]|uniref:extracellular solute-binding protein n=1 Tax=Streptomyces sp. NPDC046985 TaxID=3155377 RepID=UPI0033CFD8EE
MRRARSRSVRRLAPLCLLSLLLLATGACTRSAPRPAATAADFGAGPIVVASGRDVTGKDGVRQRLIDAWNDKQRDQGTGYRARLVELPGSADEQRSQLLGALQSGSSSYDVVNLDVTWVPEFAEAGLIEPLPDDMVDSDVIPPVAATARWKGRVYAVPFNSDVGLLYYRRDYLRAAGYDDASFSANLTWSTLQERGEAVETQADHPKEFRTWTTQLAPYEGFTVNALEAFASATTDFSLTDASGRYTATRQELTDGITELRRRVESPYTLAAAKDSYEPQSLGSFTEGHTVFLRHWPYAYSTLHQTFNDEQLGVAPLPGRAVLGGQNLAVASASHRSKGAADLISYLTTAESERCLLDAGFAATRVKTYQQDSVRCPPAASAASPSASPGGESAKSKMPRDAAGRPQYARGILLPALRSAVLRPRTPFYGAFTQTFTDTLRPLLDGDPPSDAVLAGRLDAALRKVLPH